VGTRRWIGPPGSSISNYHAPSAQSNADQTDLPAGEGNGERESTMCHTPSDLPQQLTQRDYLTQAPHERMSPAHRFLLDVEPLAEGQQVVRQPKGAESRNWWN
jgi:hypothetical protein